MSSDDEDREEWDHAWRASPHRRLTSPPKVGVSRDFIARFGVVVAATISLDPPQYRGTIWRESDSCPVCGEATAGSERLPASLFPTLASGFRYGLGVWVHRTCFETCPDTGEPAPVPW